MSDLTEVFDAEFHERLRTLAEGPDEYVEIMQYGLELTVRDLGEIDAEPTEVTMDLTNARVVSAYDGRVIRIDDKTTTLRAEADHRGPEHGVDAWVGTDGSPEAVIESIELVGVQA